jgi:NADPH-dependent glutamate synthase beta subunit-like oxidoreductase
MQDLDKLWAEPQHVVAICGGAVSGSEAAAICAEQGVLAVVFEQNIRPYGKIEDGLPRWHDKLRQKEFERIDDNLAHERVLFVPGTLVGRDVSFADVQGDPAVSAVLMANGAWRDRPLAIAGIEQLQGKGLIYQNAFVYWFNHYEEVGYSGPSYRVEDDSIVIGGGLASVDVAKIINLELYRSALGARGLPVSIVELEHLGIPKTLALHGIRSEELGIRGATIYYRRRRKDMPIAFAKDDSPEQVQKTEIVREKMVQILAQKYLIRVEECHIPVGTVADGERVCGVRFRRSEMRAGKLTEIAGSDYEVPSRLVISSIGSVPEPLHGIPMHGELYDYANFTTGELRGLKGVFGLGNVLTGQGNIKDSRDSARDVSARTLSEYLGVTAGSAEHLLDGVHREQREAAEGMVERALLQPKAQPEQIRVFLARVLERWREVGYAGDYRAWIHAHRPG